VLDKRTVTATTATRVWAAGEQMMSHDSYRRYSQVVAYNSSPWRLLRACSSRFSVTRKGAARSLWAYIAVPRYTATRPHRESKRVPP